jgi:FKBP-type peptidyl-prolyl cis-trans isomerase FkpA
VRLARVSTLIVACAALAALPLANAACSNDSTSVAGPTDYAPFSQTDLKVGSGTAAAAGKSVTVNYTGWLYDPSKGDHKGLLVDTSIGRSTFTFPLGTGAVIPGWDQGLVGMQVGGIRRLTVPPSLAYGGTRNGPIPPYATLVFEIDLLDVQ